MARFTRRLLTGFAGLAFATLAATASAQGKVGFVSLERLLRDAAPAKAASARLESEFKKREQDVQDIANKLRGLSEKLDKDGAVMSESERTKRSRELSELDKDFQRKRRELQEDLNQRRNEEMSSIIEKANRVIKQIAEAEKYDIIFQEAVYVNPSVDITEKVLKTLNASK
jgi:outer membrane protein